MFSKAFEVKTTFLKNLNAIKLLAQTELRDAIKDGSQQLFDANPNLDGFVIVGWTPEWNDGEDCYHTSVVYFTNEGKYSDMRDAAERIYGDDDVYYTMEHNDGSFPHIEKLLNMNKNLPKDNSGIYVALNNLDAAIEGVMVTDYAFIVTRNEDGTASVHHMEYTCGW